MKKGIKDAIKVASNFECCNNSLILFSKEMQDKYEKSTIDLASAQEPKGKKALPTYTIVGTEDKEKYPVGMDVIIEASMYRKMIVDDIVLLKINSMEVSLKIPGIDNINTIEQGLH